MGEEIDAEDFSEDDRRRFAERCRDGLTALEGLLARPGFGAGPPSLGVELEIGLVDAEGRPAPVNEAVRDAIDDDRLDLELDRFNLEYNSLPVGVAGRPLAALGADLAPGARARDGGRGAGRRAPDHRGHPADAVPGRPRARRDERLGPLPRARRRPARPARRALRDRHRRARAAGAELGGRDARGGRDRAPRPAAHAPVGLRGRLQRGADRRRAGARGVDQLAPAAAAPPLGGDPGRPLRPGGGRPRAGDRVVVRVAGVLRARLDRRPDRAVRRERGPPRADPPGGRRRGPPGRAAARGARRGWPSCASTTAPSGAGTAPSWPSATTRTCASRCARCPPARRCATCRRTSPCWWG